MMVSLATEFLVLKESTHEALFDGIETKLLVFSSKPIIHKRFIEFTM